MPHDPAKGHAALRRGRDSLQGAEYFLTLCTDRRCSGLTLPVVAASILTEARMMDADASWKLRCLVVMPDHVHALVVLGDRLPVGKCIARLKAKTAAALRLSPAELTWERGFFDRRIRPDEDRLALFLYIYLNPWRAALCRRGKPWSWYFCHDDDWNWFRNYLDADLPPPEWLA